MIDAVEYQKIKKTGMNIGYILDLYFNDIVENIYEIKEQVINLSKAYMEMKDISIVKPKLQEIISDVGLQELLCSLIQDIGTLNKEELMVYTNSIHIPNDHKFIEDYQQFGHNATKLSELYHVTINDIFTKVMEVKMYRIYDYQENQGHIMH